MNSLKLFDLTNKTALVTGGTGWLGQAIAEGLAEAGAAVIVSSRNPARAEEAAARLVTENEQHHVGVSIDQMDADSIRAGFEQAIALAGSIDILVNNGLEAVASDLTTITFEEFARHQKNNAGYFDLARHVRDHAVARSASASIISIGSMYGQVGSYPETYDGICAANPVAYQTLKGGTIQMTKHLAVYWAKDNVRVNCVSPGPFPNPASAPPELIERLKIHSPMMRMGQPHELKGAIVFLASDASSYVTGQNITVDGGWTAW
ncbi:MAG: SDR family oxidoreductase [Planctomycetales bacterium]|nr:SDR family oxidoreductase [Planctomycetales bacterium]